MFVLVHIQYTRIRVEEIPSTLPEKYKSSCQSNSGVATHTNFKLWNIPRSSNYYCPFCQIKLVESIGFYSPNINIPKQPNGFHKSQRYFNASDGEIV